MGQPQATSLCSPRETRFAALTSVSLRVTIPARPVKDFLFFRGIGHGRRGVEVPPVVDCPVRPGRAADHAQAYRTEQIVLTDGVAVGTVVDHFASGSFCFE